MEEEMKIRQEERTKDEEKKKMNKRLKQKNL